MRGESEPRSRSKPSSRGHERSDGSVEIHFKPVSEGLSLHASRAEGSLVRLCGSECSYRLEPGTYRFALSRGAGDPVVASGRTEVTESLTLEGAYTSNEGERLVGAVILVTGITSGLASLLMGVGLTMEGEGSVGAATAVGGGVLLTGSTIAGLVLLLTGDDAKIFPRHP